MGRLQFCLKLLAYWIFDTFFSTICRREYREEARCKKTTQTGRQAGRQCSQAFSIFLVHTPKCFWLYDFKLKYRFANPSSFLAHYYILPTRLLALWLTKTSMQANLLQTDSKYSIKTLYRSRAGNSEVPIYNSCTNLAYKVLIHQAESSKSCVLYGKENPCAGESAVL